MGLKENIDALEARICEACEKAGRDRSEVTLIAVTKTHPVEVLQEAYDLGLRVFGENKVQELCAKVPELPDDIQWHMIGHLQRNKVKMIIDKVAMIHSVESLRLAETIEKEAAKAERVMPVLLEVNIAGEESKYGLAPAEVLPLVKEISTMPHVKVEGLMTVAPNTEDPEDVRGVFENLRKLAVDIKKENIDNVNMNVLSMGMTGDFFVAIEEGATFVRVGTAIFGQRDYSKA